MTHIYQTYFRVDEVAWCAMCNFPLSKTWTQWTLSTYLKAHTWTFLFIVCELCCVQHFSDTQTIKQLNLLRITPKKKINKWILKVNQELTEKNILVFVLTLRFPKALQNSKVKKTIEYKYLPLKKETPWYHGTTYINALLFYFGPLG